MGRWEGGMKSIFTILILSIFWSFLFVCAGIFSGMITITASPDWLLHPLAALYRHLKLSIVPFGALFVLYFYLINRIRSELGKENSVLSRLTFYDRLLNTTISMFFGVGVIWTAIGMETALMSALDGTGASTDMTAQGVLKNLVNGGLLLALSTTVFGGACGYMLRLLKIVFIGRNWDRIILKEADANG